MTGQGLLQEIWLQKEKHSKVRLFLACISTWHIHHDYCTNYIRKTGNLTSLKRETRSSTTLCWELWVGMTGAESDALRCG